MLQNFFLTDFGGGEEVYGSKARLGAAVLSWLKCRAGGTEVLSV